MNNHKKILHFRKLATKKFHFATTTAKKCKNLTVFGEIIAYLQNQIAKKLLISVTSCEKTCDFCRFLEKQLCIYATNLNKNCIFKKKSPLKKAPI